jgi:putative hydrolase of the HAD superfamily
MLLKKSIKKRSLWFVDLDDTLHDATNGTLKNIDSSMTKAIQNLLVVDKKKADFLRKKYWVKYGATVVGLNRLHKVSISEFLNDSHSSETLADLNLGSIGFVSRIKRVKGAKWLVTNSPEKYAISVLKRLKIQKCFDKVISVEKMIGPGGLKPKPQVFQWRRLIRLSGVPANEITVVDDCLENLKTAKLLGCQTIWAQCFRKNYINHQIHSVTPFFVDKKIFNLSDLLRL